MNRMQSAEQSNNKENKPLRNNVENGSRTARMKRVSSSPSTKINGTKTTTNSNRPPQPQSHSFHSGSASSSNLSSTMSSQPTSNFSSRPPSGRRMNPAARQNNTSTMTSNKSSSNLTLPTSAPLISSDELDNALNPALLASPRSAVWSRIPFADQVRAVLDREEQEFTEMGYVPQNIDIDKTVQKLMETEQQKQKRIDEAYQQLNAGFGSKANVQL